MLRLWSSAAFVAFVVVLGIAVGQVQAGTVTITGPDSFLLGGSTTLTATLTPPPTAPTSITITSYNRVVAYASHNTLDFPAGSNTLTFSVLSPPNGRLGGATFLFTPADLLAYDETAFNVTVQGTISASVDNSCKGYNTVTAITVTISPAAPKDIFILAGSSTSGSTSAYFNIGQAVATTTFTELQPGTVTVTFSHPLYQSTSVTYTVLRTFSSTAPAVVTNGNITFTASATLAPATPTELTVTSNIGAQLPSQTFTFASAGVVVSVNADRVYPAGTFVTTLTAAGYCPLTITTVSLPPTCTPGTQVTYFGTCGNCPGFLTGAGACGNVGVCLQSTCQVGQLRCSCPSGFKGRACEFGPTALTFGVSATTSTVAVGVVTFQPTSSFAVPIVQGVFAPLTNGISALYGSNPAVGAPQFSTPFYGFQVGFLCNDNTEFSASGTPVSISLLLNRGVISDRDADDLRLYYFDVPSKTYISETRCTGNTTLSSFVDNAGRQVISFQICFSGVYQFFSIDPGNRPALAPSVKARPIEVTSGQTGLQPQFPPDPSFNVDQFLGEPLHLAIGSVDSAFTIQPAISLIVVMVVLVMAFIA